MGGVEAQAVNSRAAAHGVSLSIMRKGKLRDEVQDGPAAVAANVRYLDPCAACC